MPKKPAGPAVTTLYEVEYPIPITTLRQATNGPYSVVERFSSQAEAEVLYNAVMRSDEPAVAKRLDLLVLRKVITTAPIVTVLRSGNYRHEEAA